MLRGLQGIGNSRARFGLFPASGRPFGPRLAISSRFRAGFPVDSEGILDRFGGLSQPQKTRAGGTSWSRAGRAGIGVLGADMRRRIWWRAGRCCSAARVATKSRLPRGP